jgi:hypothetical protein
MMMKKKWGFVIGLFFLFSLVQDVCAENWVESEDRLRLAKVSSTALGLEFKIRNITPVSAPNSICNDTNWFVIPRAHPDFNVLSALVITASATGKKISVVFDHDSVECLVPVDSVTIY